MKIQYKIAKYILVNILVLNLGIICCVAQTVDTLNFSPVVVTTIKNDDHQIGVPGDYVYVVNFWFVACAPCRKEIPLLNELSNLYSKKQKVKFIAISVVDNDQVLSSFSERVKFKFELAGNGKSIADQLNIQVYPTNMVIDKKGNIAYRHEGYNANIIKDIQTIIDSLL